MEDSSWLGVLTGCLLLNEPPTLDESLGLGRKGDHHALRIPICMDAPLYHQLLAMTFESHFKSHA